MAAADGETLIVLEQGKGGTARLHAVQVPRPMESGGSRSCLWIVVLSTPLGAAAHPSP